MNPDRGPGSPGTGPAALGYAATRTTCGCVPCAPARCGSFRLTSSGCVARSGWNGLLCGCSVAFFGSADHMNTAGTTPLSCTSACVDYMFLTLHFYQQSSVPAVQRCWWGRGWGWWGLGCVPAGGSGALPSRCGSLSSRPPGIQPGARRHPLAGSRPGWCQTFPVDRGRKRKMTCKETRWKLTTLYHKIWKSKSSASARGCRHLPEDTGPICLPPRAARSGVCSGTFLWIWPASAGPGRHHRKGTWRSGYSGAITDLGAFVSGRRAPSSPHVQWDSGGGIWKLF